MNNMFFLIAIFVALVSIWIIRRARAIGDKRKRRAAQTQARAMVETVELLKKFVPAPIVETFVPKPKRVYDTTRNLDKFWLRCKRGRKTFWKKGYLNIVLSPTDEREAERYFFTPIKPQPSGEPLHN